MTDPVALSEEELANWRDWMEARGTLDDVAPASYAEKRLLATIESRDQRIRRLVAGQHATTVALIAALDALRPGDD